MTPGFLAFTHKKKPGLSFCKKQKPVFSYRVTTRIANLHIIQRRSEPMYHVCMFIMSIHNMIK